MIYVFMYLLAIILANLSVAQFGPSAVIVNAFLFIGLDLTARDKLHDAWKGDRLVLKMTALVVAGSVLSWILNRAAANIALASFVAFLFAGIFDALVYQSMSSSSALKRVNGSNVVAAVVDSIIFPTLAFGVFLPYVIIGQIIAKVAGGFVWSLALRIK